MNLTKLSDKLQVVNSTISDTVEVNFGWVDTSSLFKLKVDVAKSLKHFNPKGTATFIGTENGNSTKLTLLFVRDESFDGVFITDF